MKYAVDCELIAKAPKIGLYKVERPEIEPWDFEQYARLLAAAKIEGADWYAAAHAPADPAKPSCCAVTDPRGATLEASFDPRQPAVSIPRRVVKGGSFLCAPNYCRRYRPAARHAQMSESGMSHIGLRCIRRETA